MHTQGRVRVWAAGAKPTPPSVGGFEKERLCGNGTLERWNVEPSNVPAEIFIRPSVRPGWRAGPAQILIRPSLRPGQRASLAIGRKVEPSNLPTFRAALIFFR